jgi:carbon-monoxide dehydrogenase medium subunit
MRPSRFALHRPSSVGEALALKARHGEEASFYAGGTELLVALKARVLQYGHLIDLKPLAELRHISAKDDGTLAIGALATHHAIANDPLVRKFLPAYAELSEDVGNIRVRVAGTIGGVLCFAEPHADAPTLLSALDARLRLAGTGGERVVALRDFYRAEFTTERRDDELLLAIVPPWASRRSGVAAARSASGSGPGRSAACRPGSPNPKPRRASFPTTCPPTRRGATCSRWSRPRPRCFPRATTCTAAPTTSATWSRSSRNAPSNRA